MKAADQFGNPKSGVVVTWTHNATGGSLSATSSTTAADGTASVVYTVGTKTGTDSVTASATGLTSAVFTETVIPGNPATATFAVNPSGSSGGATITPAVQVQVADSGGNVISGASVKVALAGGTTGATLSGTLTQKTNAQGIASFGDLSVDKSGSGYTLTATVGAAQGTSATFTVSSGGAKKMIPVPGGSTSITFASGVLPSAAPLAGIEVTDAGGNGVAGDSVTVTLDSGSASGPLKGAFTLATDANGQITLAEILTVANAGNSGSNGGESAGTFVLTFTNASLTGSPISVTALVTPGPASQVEFGANIPQGTAGVPLPTVTVAVTDGGGNVITSATGNVVMSLNGGPAGATLTGTVTEPLVQGVATFSNLILNRVSGSTTYSLKATSNGFSTISNPFPVTAGAAAAVFFTTSGNGIVPSTVTAGATIGGTNGVSVVVLDNQGNKVTSGTVTVTMTLTGGTAGAIALRNDVGRVGQRDRELQQSLGSTPWAPVTNWLRRRMAGLTGATSTAFAVTANSTGPTQLKFVQQPTLSTSTVGSPLSPSAQVELDDALGNKTSSTDSIAITLTTASNPFNAVVSNAGARAVGGTASFASASINVGGSNYVLQAVDVTNSSVTAVTSSSFSVVYPGLPHLRALATDPNNPQAGTSFTYTLVLTDTVSTGGTAGPATPIAGQPIVVSAGTVNGSPSPVTFDHTALVTDANGQATVTVTFGNAMGTQAWNAATGNGQANFGNTVTVVAAATHFSIFEQPPNTAASGATLGNPVVLQLVDGSGNSVFAGGVSVTASVASGTRTATLGGTKTVSTSLSGQATFSG